MSTQRILSLDGGGIRGVLTTSILERLDKECPGFLSKVDLFAGTSTGGLIALGLAHGARLQEIQDIYIAKGSKVFADTLLDDIFDLGQIVGAQYDNRNLERELKRILGKTTLAELQKKVLITAFDLENGSGPDRSWKPKLFHNFAGEDSDGTIPAYKVGLYTSAAPSYFPSVDGYIDGGVFANNPSMCALAQTQDPRAGVPSKLSDILLLSIGTGRPVHYIPGRRHDWGYAQWAKPILTLILDGVDRIADYQCKMILGEQYHRIQPLLKDSDSFSVDAVKNVPAFVKIAEDFKLSDTVDWLRKYWMKEDSSAAVEHTFIGPYQPVIEAETREIPS